MRLTGPGPSPLPACTLAFTPLQRGRLPMAVGSLPSPHAGAVVGVPSPACGRRCLDRSRPRFTEGRAPMRSRRMKGKGCASRIRLDSRRSMQGIERWPSGTLPHPPVANATGTFSRKREKEGAPYIFTLKESARAIAQASRKRESCVPSISSPGRARSGRAPRRSAPRARRHAGRNAAGGTRLDGRARRLP